MMQRTWYGLAVVVSLGLRADVGLAAKPLLELKVGDEAYVGRSVARNEDVCWLQSPDGRLMRLPLQRVTGYRKVAPQFRGLSVTEVRDQLAREWQRGLEVSASGSYAVAAPAGKARVYATLLDQVHREFTTFFSRRNFGLQQPEFPLIALIFPTEEAFAEYCRSDGMGFAPGLRGYYNPETNRIAFFEDAKSLGLAPARSGRESALAAISDPGGRGSRRAERESTLNLVGHSAGVSPFDAVGSVTLGLPFADPRTIAAAGTIDANFRDTLVHEATHQLAFNMGLHARIGDNPRWVVEGIAMIFERNAGDSQGRRINQERYDWFMKVTRKDVMPLKEFIAFDRPFGARVLDAYAQSWALAFYLSEKRPADFSKYLQTIRQHDPLADYTADDRVADFQSAFGKDIDWLQVEWLRFMDAL